MVAATPLTVGNRVKGAIPSRRMLGAIGSSEI